MGGDHGVAAIVSGAEGTKEGLRALRISAFLLATAAIFQFIVVGVGGSAGLLADALDNLGDVITTIVLWIAFIATRRAADHRYTFGYQRLEDLAGVFVVLVIWASAIYAGIESYKKLVGEHTPTAIGLGLAAAAFGAVNNEIVARYKIAVGKRINSPPLIADGRHARTDALASVAAFAGLAGVEAGFPEADAIAGLVITAAIAWIAYGASRQVLARLLDAVDPEIIARIESVAVATPGVTGTGRVQARWAGRSLYVTLTVGADPNLTLAAAHEVAEAVHHEIIHEFPGVAQVDVHVDPGDAHGDASHARTHNHPAPERAHDHVHRGDGDHHH
jgi:cation diffusion facilitator family transporter